MLGFTAFKIAFINSEGNVPGLMKQEKDGKRVFSTESMKNSDDDPFESFAKAQESTSNKEAFVHEEL